MTFAGVLVLALSAVLDRRGCARSAGDDWAAYDHKSFVVTHVSDGDTIFVKPVSGGPETKVRLIGVDTPELHPASAAGGDYWAREAKRYTATHAHGRPVTLRLESTSTRDKYRRLLAYVYVADSENLNLDLVRDGQGYADRRFRHSMRPHFEQAEAEARRRGKGLWKDVTEEKMPPWRRQWLEHHPGARRP
jgi:endonuclease YncB( thermonuclease family)